MSNTPPLTTPPTSDLGNNDPMNPAPVSFPGTVSWGSFFGIPVYVHIFAPLPLLAMMLLVRTTGGGSLLLVLAGASLSLLFHEFGHAFVARWCGYAVRGIVVYPLRNLAVIQEAMQPRHEMLVALGGPAFSLILGLLSWGYLAGAGNAAVRPEQLRSIAGGEMVAYLLLINATVMIGNLIPALPFDGGTCFRAFLMRTTSRTKATRRVARIGLGFSAAFILIGVILKVPLVALFGLMIFVGTMREVGQEKGEAAIAGAVVREAMQTDFCTASVADRVHDLEEQYTKYRQRFFPVVQGDQIVGTIDYETVRRFLAHKQGAAYVREGMNDQFTSVQPSDSLVSVMRRLEQNNNRPILVLEGEKLVGLLTEDVVDTFLRRRDT